MLIKQLLNESAENINVDNILNNKYFNEFIRPKIDLDMLKALQELESIEDNNTLSKDRVRLFKISEAFKNPEGVLFHGSEFGAFETGDIYNMKTRTKSRDSNELVHHVVNDMAEEKFDVKLRNLMFTIQSPSIASDYLNTPYEMFIILPIGDYTLYFSREYPDFYVDYFREGYELRELNKKIGQTVSFLINDYEKQIRELSGEYDDWTFFKIVQHSIVKHVGYGRFYILNSMNTYDDITKKHDEALNVTTDFIEFQMDKRKEPLNDAQIKGLKTIVEQILSGYEENIRKALKKFANDYIKTIMTTTDPSDVFTSNEIMLECDKFTVINAMDFINVVEAVRNSHI